MFNYYFFKTFLNLSTIYLLCGLGNCITIKSGDMNLGGEGQIYAGGFTAALFLNAVKDLSPLIALPLAFIIAVATGIVITLISCWLKKARNISFLLSSFIFSSALIPILDGLVTGPFRTTQGTLLATPFISQSFRFPYFVNLIFALIFAVLIYLFINKTKIGKTISLYGTAPEFTLFAGANETKILCTSSIIAGALHGFAGCLAVCGIYYTCHCSFSQGMGWNALATAMIAKSSPILTIPAAFFMGFLITTADQYALLNNFNFDISTLIQAVIIIIVAVPFTKKAFSLKKGGKKCH